MSKPILVLGYGNPSRGDDALGPLLLDFIQQHLDTSQFEIVTDFQLQIEHALDLQNREFGLIHRRIGSLRRGIRLHQTACSQR